MKSKLKRQIVPEMSVEPAPHDLIEPVKTFLADEGFSAPYKSGGGSRREFFFGLLESAPDVFFSLTPEGAITYINPAFEALTGWERDMWIGRGLLDLLVDDTGHTTARNPFKCENGDQRKVFEADILLSGGGSISTEVSVSFRRRRDKVIGIIGSLRDNTDRKRSDEAHALREKRSRSLI